MDKWQDRLRMQIEACADELKISAVKVLTAAEFVNRGKIIITLDPNDTATINYDFDVIPRAEINKNV